MPAVATLSLQGAVGQSANLVEVKNSTGTILSLVDLSGNLTAASITTTGSTVPTNGVYLPAANTLGLATNGASVLQIGSTGKIGIGTTPPSATSLNLASTMSGSTSTSGFRSAGVVQSGSTDAANYFTTSVSTAASAFTVTNVFHYLTSQGTIGASSAITNQYGFYVDATLIGATNNYGVFSNIAAAANRWNLYANGTAANYFAGQTSVGSTSLSLATGGNPHQFGVVSTAAARAVLIARGATSQTANILEAQDGSGNIVASIDSAGQIRTINVLNRNSFNNSRFQLRDNGPIIDTGIAANAALIVQHTNASATAPILQLQNSSATVIQFTQAGTINFVTGNTSATATIGAVTAPVMVAGYITMQVAGTTVKVPYYNN